MSLMRGVRLIACALAVLALFAVPNARADEYTKLTYLTFSGPVQLPGVALPAGTYMFKLADPDSGRRVMQVWDKEGTKLYTTLLTIPDERTEATDKPAVMFSERPSGQPAAIKSWFYPDERTGYEFVYPKQQAMDIAKDTHSPVLSYADASSKNNDSASMRSAKIGRIDENGQAVENSKAADNRSNTSNTASTSAANANNNDNSAAPSQSASVNRAPAAATTAADNDDAASTTATRAGARPAQSTTAQSTTAPSTTAQSTTAQSNANQSAAQAPSANRTQSSPAVGTSGTTASNNTSGASSAAVGTTGTANRANNNRQRANDVNNNRANQSDRGSNAAAPRQSLPKTASPLGTLELLSGLTLAGAFALRGLRKRPAENRV